MHVPNYMSMMWRYFIAQHMYVLGFRVNLLGIYAKALAVDSIYSLCTSYQDSSATISQRFTISEYFHFYFLERTMLVFDRFPLSPFAAYYRGAMGILLVYDVTDESSFNNIRNWIHNIEQHASDNVNKILVGNKVDMDLKRVVSTAQGQKLACEYRIKFF
jgi:hypothetical protein